MIPENLPTFDLDEDHRNVLAITPVVTKDNERVRLVMELIKPDEGIREISQFFHLRDDQEPTIVIHRCYLNDKGKVYYRQPIDRYTDYGLACKEFHRRSDRLLASSDEVKANSY